MILHINNSEYDYHTLVKVAEMAGLAGLVGFHESEDGYSVAPMISNLGRPIS